MITSRSIVYLYVLYLLIQTLLAQQPQLTTLFSTCYKRDCYPTCYRQPVLIIIDSKNIISLAEGRNNTYCSGTDDGYPSSIRLRRSDDGGITWSSPEQVIYTGHCDFLAAVHDYQSGRTHLFIQAPPTGALYTYSENKGLTWTVPAPGKIEGPPGYTFTPSVSHGIQISGDYCEEPTCNGLAGRLVVSFVCHKTAMDETEKHVMQWRDHVEGRYSAKPGDIGCKGCYTCLAVSDNHGATWTIHPGAVSKQEGSREASIVQLRSSVYNTKNPVIYATERNFGNSTGFRIHAISVDGGDSFSIFGSDPELPDSKVTNWTGIVAGVARMVHEGKRVGHVAGKDTWGGVEGEHVEIGAPEELVVFTTPMKKTARADMGIYVSKDETVNWSSGQLYFSGPAGYSDIYMLNTTHMAIIFENGETEFAQRISFGVFVV